MSELSKLMKAKRGKKCSVCGIVQPRENFGQVVRASGYTSIRGACRTCLPIQTKLRKYGLTYDQYLDLPKACESCGAKNQLHIDHDHSTGKYRGVLCRPCNQALGFLQDDVEKIRGLERYLATR